MLCRVASLGFPCNVDEGYVGDLEKQDDQWFCGGCSSLYTWLARDVIAACRWSFLLVLAKKSKFGGVKLTSQKVCTQQQGHHDGS